MNEQGEREGEEKVRDKKEKRTLSSVRLGLGGRGGVPSKEFTESRLGAAWSSRGESCTVEECVVSKKVKAGDHSTWCRCCCRPAACHPHTYAARHRGTRRQLEREAHTHTKQHPSSGNMRILRAVCLPLPREHATVLD